MPVALLPPASPRVSRAVTSKRRGSIAVPTVTSSGVKNQEPPSRLTARRCSLGRIFVEPEDDALAIFSKYQSSFARRLKKNEAITMLMTEFELADHEAELMFSAFDKDNNEVMSLWEFRQFYQTVGNQAHSIVELFKSLEVEDTGKIDIEKAFDKMQTLSSGKGPLTDEEIEMFLRTTAGEAKEIDFSKFLNMMCRIKLYKGSN